MFSGQLVKEPHERQLVAPGGSLHTEMLQQLLGLSAECR